MTRVKAGAFTALAFLLLATTSATPAVFAQAVGGVQVQRNAGPYEILIAENPSNLSVGIVVISVAVLDASTGDHVPGAIVTIRTRHRRTGEEGWAFAVNTVLPTSYEAQLKLSTPGTWDIAVEVDSSLGKVSVEGLPVNIPISSRFTSGTLVFIGVFLVLIVGIGYVWWSARREQQRRRASALANEDRLEEDGERGP